MAGEPVFDFYSPFFSAVIVDREGTRYPLWTKSPNSTESLSSDSPAALCYLQSLSVELQLGFVPKITATLTPPIDEARKLMSRKCTILEWGFSQLLVQFGYSSGTPNGIVLSPIYQGILLNPQFTFGADVSITLNAQGTGGFSAAKQTQGKTYNGTRWKIIEEIARGPNATQPRNLKVDVSAVEGALLQDLNSRVSSQSILSLTAGNIVARAGSKGSASSMGSNNSATPFYRRMFEEEVVESQGYMSDWMLIWKLVRECRCTMLLLEDTLKIIPANMWLGSKPKRTFRFYDYPQGKVGPIAGVFPITEVSCDQTVQFLAAGVDGMILRGVNSRTGQDQQEDVNDATMAGDRTGAAGGQTTREGDENRPAVDPATGEGAGYYSGSPDNDTAVVQAEAEYSALTTNGSLGTQLELTSLLDPGIFPGDTITVTGISDRHDGNYGILNAKYDVGTEATMTLTIVSNLGLLTSQVFDQNVLPKGAVNTQEPEDTDARTSEVPTQASAEEQSLP